MDKINSFFEFKENVELINMNLNLFEEDELEDDYEDFNLGKKRKVSLKDIDDVGNFGIYKGDFKKDIGVLDNLCVNF